ncbi:ABC transporter ATP-binding protein [Modestobacter versicolor]|uniref:ABC-type transport system involved in cytochrome c biogenesis ATPase subunit n=1 Tax=Modestobacter versicolor TaxID=429133 RepID=A0A839XSL4_9ACTN|nr:ATP-binding cassette domain-containing protein [Modestobacter versicolor]MBB3674620.1 ABC-type transport system involved in cytochrome c biogenesis ATPase subunit [Modestobacter versicolor]
MPALTAEGLAHRHGRGPWLVEGLSLAVPAGGLLRVRGGNGSGKSTLLRLLAGSVVPRRGTVRRSGPVGYLPQQTGDLPGIDAARLVGLLTGGVPDGVPGTRADQLSRGWQRRVLLEAVLALPCPVLVLDEPAAGLDAAAVSRLADRLTGRLAAGHAVVVAEHEPLPLAGGEVLDLGGSVTAAVVEVLLAGTGTFRGRTATGGRLTLTVPAGEQDAVLLAALQEGWSVLTVARR